MPQLNRKQRRALSKIANKQATSTIDLMLGLGDKCKICEKKFIKNKEELPNWFVEVYKEDKKINLFCKNCWESK